MGSNLGVAMRSEKKPSIKQIVFSVLAAMFGVQSEQARKRDFEFGRPWHYVVVGLVMTILFVLSIVTVVKLVMHISVN